MFGYYLDLAWRSLKRTPVLTGLMVPAMAPGIQLLLVDTVCG